MHYKFWYIGSVLWKAWWWLNTVETCCHKNILCNKLLCLTEIYTLYDVYCFVCDWHEKLLAWITANLNHHYQRTWKTCLSNQVCYAEVTRKLLVVKWSDWTEVSYGEVLVDKGAMYIRVTLYCGNLIILWLFHLGISCIVFVLICTVVVLY